MSTPDRPASQDAPSSVTPAEREGWRQATRDPGFRVRAIATAIALPLALTVLSQFLLWIEDRPGVVLDDPLLAAIPSRDVSVPTFALIYGGMLLALVMLLRCPRHLVIAIQGYVILILARMALMWATPLDPPTGFVQLDDPLVESFGPARALTRDLFFSGHTSTLFLLFLAVPIRWARWILLTATILVAALLLWQHAHYTVDVLVAPFVAYCACRLAARLCGAARPTLGDARSGGSR